MSSNNLFLQALKAVVISLIFSLFCILIFAIILNVFSLPNAVIKPVNYLIKSLSVFLGAYFTISGERGAFNLFFGIFHN